MKLRAALGAAIALSTLSSPALASTTIKNPWWFDKSVLGATIKDPNDLQLCSANCGLLPQLTAAGPVLLGFEGNNQYQNAVFQRNFIPPDTMGAVGGAQYMITTNGSYGIYDKYTGAQLSLTSDNAFWAAAGQATGTNGDTRIMYNAAAHRWIMVAFGSNVKDLQVAVSDTDDALGGWKSVKFEGYAGLGFGGTADYPTLALDGNAVYIGTNNFAPATSGGANTFRGTTLNVIPIDSLFGVGAPTVAGMKQFETPFNPAGGQTEDRGFALQGVNSTGASGSGTIVAASLFDEEVLTFSVNGLTTSSAAGSSLGGVNFVGEFTTAGAYQGPGPARQPSQAIAANQRIIATLDERISSSVYEHNGKLYVVHTVDPLTDTGDYARVRLLVIDKASNTVQQSIDIGSGEYDYYQGSIAVNSKGAVVVGYNRSGLNPTDGKIGFYASTFAEDAYGNLIATNTDLLLKESLTDDYHNGSLFGQAAAGRQRWGDYSQVSVDPNDPDRFYLIGEFAREYNLPQFGHPGGTGGSRWSTWVAVISTGVPEPSTWIMMIVGFGMVGGAMRRKTQTTRVTYA